MNCQAVRNQILHLPDPRELPPDLRAHVAACAGCAAWARQAAVLEAALERLPVPAPPAGKKERTLAALARAEPLSRPAGRPGFLRRHAGALSGLAAGVLVAAGAYWLVSRPKPPQEPEVVRTEKHPLLEKVVAGNTALARAGTPVKRLEALAGMADAIAGEARGMARVAGGGELRQMAGWYDEVVTGGLVRQADKLPLDMPAQDKVRLLNGVADKLAADAAEADKLSREAPPDAQPALQRLAAAARAGEQALRKGK